MNDNYTNQLKKLSDEVHAGVEKTVAKVKKICQPKLTGEWTAEYVRSIAVAPDQYTRVANAHNAALLKQWDEYQRLLREYDVTMTSQFRKHLAVEREKVELTR